MTRLALPSLAFGGALLCAGAAVAQYGGYDAPRPPGSVPVRPQAQPQYAPAPPEYAPQYAPYPQQPYPQQPQYAPQPAPPPRPSGIQSEDLPTPGGAPQGAVQPAALPPAQNRQPRPNQPNPGQPNPDQPASGAAAPGAQQAPAPSPADVVTAPPPERIANPTAVFSGLDKITGRITSFEEAIGETVQFGALRVTTRACYSRPPTETPRTDGFVEVDEVTLQGAVKRIFDGWMFAASPGLHAVEHPVYDVWLVDCKGGGHQAAAEPQPAAPAAAPPRQQPPQQRQNSRQRQPR